MRYSDMNSLYQLVYSSTRSPECSESSIDDILASCKKNNPETGITGILIHSKNRFVQYLEGNLELHTLYHKIKEDRRHYDVMLLIYRPIRERVFPNWHMGFKDVDNIHFETRLDQEDKQIFEGMLKGEIPETDSGIAVLKRFLRND